MVKKMFIIAAIALVGCNSDEVDITTGVEVEEEGLFVKPEVVIEDGKVSLSKAEEVLIEGYEDFALTSTCDLMPEDSNFVYSPLSATLVLSLTANGADGTTYDELVTAMGFKGKDIDEINRLNYTLLQALPALNEDVGLSFANALFTQEGCQLLRPFKSRLTDAYDGQFFTFEEKQEADQINAWVSEKTKGLITDLMDESDFKNENEPLPQHNYSFVNVCHLKGSWFSPFAKTEKKSFSLSDGSQDVAEYVVELQRIGYANRDGIEVLSLSLGKTQDFEVDFVLPAPGQTVSKAFDEINEQGGFSAVGKSMERSFVVLSIPKFKISEKIKLVDWLKQKGVKEMFDKRTANFTKMAVTPRFVSDVKQRCEFELDEDGVCGAAASDVHGYEISPGDGSKPEYREITLDRPFGFCVREAGTSAILFIGQVVHP